MIYLNRRRAWTALLSVSLGLCLNTAANAQIAINPATATGQVVFSNEDVVGVTAGGPAFDGQNKLISPGQGYGNIGNNVAVVGNTGVQPIVPPLNAIQPAGGQFGGSTLTVFGNNNGVWYANPFLTDVPNNPTLPGPASVTFARGSASFLVGAGGFSGLVGSYMALGGLIPNVQAGSFLAASLVVQINAFSPLGANFNQSFTSSIWLGFDGQGFGNNDFIAGVGANSPLNGNPVQQPNVNTGFVYTNGGNGFLAAASVITSATFLPGTQFDIFTEVTMVVNLGPGANGGAPRFFQPPPNVVPQVARPDFGAVGNSAAPEPGALSLLAIGGAVFLPLLRRRKR